MGLGLLGRGVGDAEFLAECGADLIVTDLKTDAQLSNSLVRLASYKGIKFTLGEHKLEDFEGRDMILVAAGVPSDSPYLAHAKEKGIELAQSAALFAKLSGIPMVGVTGTRGKSTVTAMIHHILETISGESVIRGGNVRGVSNLQLFKEVKEHSLAVFELDSWQLQGFGWAGISPQVAVFTTFMDDHLNYYLPRTSDVLGSEESRKEVAMEAYFADKANIFINQEESGVLITTPEVFERAKEFATGKNITLGQEVVLVDTSIIPEDAILPMPGEHNRLNAALAIAACRATGLADEEIFAALASFPGVEGRLQFLTTTEAGVKIYNDNSSTTPDATIAALHAVGNTNQPNVVLIMGGDDKGLDMKKLVAELPNYCSKIILFKERGTDYIRDTVFALAPHVEIYEEEGLRATVKRALEVSEPGEVLLYSPAFSSFGKYFKNEYDRGDQFVALIEQLI